jgi:hypothetical protein
MLTGGPAVFAAIYKYRRTVEDVECTGTVISVYPITVISVLRRPALVAWSRHPGINSRSAR